MYTHHEIGWKATMSVCKHQKYKSGVETADILLERKQAKK